MDNPYQAAQGADLVVILTEWNEFRALDLDKLARKMASRGWPICAISMRAMKCWRPGLRPMLVSGAECSVLLSR